MLLLLETVDFNHVPAEGFRLWSFIPSGWSHLAGSQSVIQIQLFLTLNGTRLAELGSYLERRMHFILGTNSKAVKNVGTIPPPASIRVHYSSCRRWCHRWGVKWKLDLQSRLRSFLTPELFCWSSTCEGPTRTPWKTKDEYTGSISEHLTKTFFVRLDDVITFAYEIEVVLTSFGCVFAQCYICYISIDIQIDL